MLKLWASTTSPFVRKARMVVLEKELSDDVEVVMIKTSPVDTNPDLKKDNPLGKLPCLVLEDGTLVIDSRVICQYLDGIGHGPILRPTGNVRHNTLEAICDGILDASVAMFYEVLARPPEMYYEPWVEAQWGKVESALRYVEAEYSDILEHINLAAIGLLCALEYLDFRADERNWRAIVPELAKWHETVKDRPSVVATRPFV